VDEEPAHTFTKVLAATERDISEWFLATQAENYSPEDREWLCSYSASVILADFMAGPTRNTVRFFIDCFTPEVCSMN